jgi:hypothetical protein
MKFINKIISKFLIARFQDKSIEQVLKNSSFFLDKQTIDEICEKTFSYISNDGGFCDRSAKSDLYYTLFGMFVGNSLNISKTKENLQNYLKNINLSAKTEGVHLYCLSILYSNLFISDEKASTLRKMVKQNVKENLKTPDYNLFLGILSLYYQNDFFTIYKILRKFKPEFNIELPCPVLAANAAIIKISGKDVSEVEQKLMTFYRGNGSFSALKNSPVGDLLSTAVALFALKFIGADLRKIKPDCLEFIDSLYYKGSFRATSLDSESDIEYTFYGLLALGSLI